MLLFELMFEFLRLSIISESLLIPLIIDIRRPKVVSSKVAVLSAFVIAISGFVERLREIDARPKRQQSCW